MEKSWGCSRQSVAGYKTKAIRFSLLGHEILQGFNRGDSKSPECTKQLEDDSFRI